jgi:hypothetical protein
MRHFMLGVLIFASFWRADAQRTIREVDFSNFTYPMSGTALGHDRLKWLDISATRHIQLVNGKGISGVPGFALKTVTFAELTGDGLEDAIVVLHFSTSGTQQTDYVYFYSFAKKPQLMAYFHSGDRAYSGLYKVYGEGGRLVVELFDASKRSGDCCSSGLVRTRYKWHDGHFELSGVPEYAVVQEP